MVRHVLDEAEYRRRGSVQEPLCTCVGSRRKHITEVEPEKANNIPLILLYMMLGGIRPSTHSSSDSSDAPHSFYHVVEAEMQIVRIHTVILAARLRC